MVPIFSYVLMVLVGIDYTEAFAPVTLRQQQQMKSSTCIKLLPPLNQHRGTERSEDENFFVPDQVLHPLKTFTYNLKAVSGEFAYAAVAFFVVIGFIPALFVISSAMAVLFGASAVILTAVDSGLTGVALLSVAAAFVSSTVPLIGRAALFAPSVFALVLGGGMVLGAFVTTVMHTFSSNRSKLRTSGAYSIVRHPMYGGLLLTSFGVAGLTDSASRAALTVLLIPLLHQKARNEERTLLEVYGPLYEEYSREVPSTVVPFVDVEIL